jgi:FixJ family two-component response regulator
MKAFVLSIALALCISTAHSIEQNDVSQMLDQFHSQGLLNADQYKDAKKKLDGLTPKQWNAVKETAAKAAEGVPQRHVANDLKTAAESVDVNSEEFKNLSKQLSKDLGDE